MKRFVAAGFLVLAAAAAPAWGQGEGNPFADRSDDGRPLHVLPLPALIRGSRGVAPAPLIYGGSPSSGTYIFPAPYGNGQLIDHGGPEISNAAFQPVYWNSSIANSTTAPGGATIASWISGFASRFSDGRNYDGSTTDDYTIVQQYGSHACIAPTLTALAPYVDTNPTAKRINDSAIISRLQTLFSSNSLTASASTVYGVYLPPGERVCAAGGCSCSSFCAYHGYFTYNGIPIKYAVFPYPGCLGCSIPGLTAGDMLTILSSHEIREAVTDPQLNAWYDSAGYEADDKCVWSNLYQTVNGGYWVQPEFSNGGYLPDMCSPTFYATYPSLSAGMGGCVIP
jgi:hypothetical protein